MKCSLEKREELAHHGMSVVAWPRAIRHSKSAEWHSHLPSGTQPIGRTLMQFHVLLCSRVIFQDRLTLKKIFLIKLGHFDMSISLIFRNHHLHHCFQKLIKSSFFKLMNSCSKLVAFTYGSFIFQKKKKKSSSFVKKKKSLRFPKLMHSF